MARYQLQLNLQGANAALQMLGNIGHSMRAAAQTANTASHALMSARMGFGGGGGAAGGGGGGSGASGGGASSWRMGSGGVPSGGGVGQSPLAAFGPKGLVIEGALRVATFQLKAFADATRIAANELAGFKDTQTISGGTSTETAILKAMGLTDPAGTARRLRENITAGGFARMAASQLGVGPIVPRELGATNELEPLLKLLEALSKLSDQELLLRARQLGDEGLIKSAMLYRRHADTMTADADAMKKVLGNDAFQKIGLDLEFQFNRIIESFNLLVTAASKPFLEEIVNGMGMLADAMRDAAIWIEKHPKTWKAIADAIIFVTAPVIQLVGALAKLVSIIGLVMDTLSYPAKAAENSAKAQDILSGSVAGASAQIGALLANTQALKQNTVALKPGVFGAGQRAQGAFPAAVKGDLLRRAVEGNALRMGAYALY